MEVSWYWMLAGRLRLVNPVSGEATRLVLRHDLQPGEQFVGSFHTHPEPSGVQGVSFSAADLIRMISRGERLSLLHSGSYVYALVRTEKTPAQLDERLFRREMASLESAALARGYTAQEALLAANLGLCERYGLTMYYSEPLGTMKVLVRP